MLFFFFFQAEDGIRDVAVTGVQTCALPISDFVRLREASITYDFPVEWARAMRASAVSVTLAGRNLWKSSNYAGVDPESNYITNAASTGTVNDFQTQPPASYWTFRLNVTF